MTSPRDRLAEHAVTFDMDGVLLDSEPLHLRVLNEVLAPLGYRATAAENEQFFGLTTEECWRALTTRYDLPGGLEDYLAQYDETALHQLRQPITPTLGAPELIAGLRRDGMRVGLASASKKVWVDATLSALGLAEAFDTVVSGDDVTHATGANRLIVDTHTRLAFVDINPFRIKRIREGRPAPVRVGVCSARDPAQPARNTTPNATSRRVKVEKLDTHFAKRLA
jgi:phosphoglycolate phosphatase-like HAD superfamily hydrolase